MNEEETRNSCTFWLSQKGSCGEVRAQLYVALDQHYLSREVFDRLSTNATEVGQLLSGFIRYLKGSKLKGNKYS
ncbi:MAG: four helix bundle protein [bacterium]